MSKKPINVAATAVRVIRTLFRSIITSEPIKSVTAVTSWLMDILSV